MRRLRAIVLGSAAGGGFPQWNCRCPACQLSLPGDFVAYSFVAPGRGPPYYEGKARETVSKSAGTVGAEISAGGARLVYIPGAAAITPRMRERLDRADVVFFDGTLFRDDEMIVS